MPERMIEAGQANAAHHHAGGDQFVGGGGGQGIMAGAANAVSVASHPMETKPHGVTTALAGIIEGTKNSIAAISTVLTTLRRIMFAPVTPHGTGTSSCV